MKNRPNYQTLPGGVVRVKVEGEPEASVDIPVTIFESLTTRELRIKVLVIFARRNGVSPLSVL